ncbi:lipocalin family protein [Vibrio zhugei]|uniref:Outer membrane lipoprotein Blc n=1 Tax=Vibrio zhugei TaxID=2479546 RepID=A0ABV7CBA3_9VIBR|nr:lipocalin family protein [Vibrio zhugei]
MNVFKTISLTLCSLLLLAGCTGKPDNIDPVTNFQLDRYLGHWYEIARLDHSFESELSNVTATYLMNNDGSVNVINRGYSKEDQEWQQAVGKAKFVKSSDIGHLKVSFFGPFYGSYIVFYLAPDYSMALITSYNRDYFWLLSRTPTLSKEKMAKARELAEQAGFDPNQFIYPSQTPISIQ